MDRLSSGLFEHGTRTLGRRGFLKVASLTIGLGAGSLLAACTPSAPASAPAPTSPPAAAPKPPVATAPPANTSPAVTTPVMKLKVGSADPPPPGQRSQMMQWWEEQVTNKTAGKITFENYWGGSLVGSGELLEAVQNRVVDVAAYSASWAAGKLPIWNFELVVPFRPSEPKLYNRIMHKLVDTVPAFGQEFGKYNVKVLNLTPMEEGYDIHSVKPIASLEDLKGKKIATPPGWMAKYVTDAGGAAVGMSAPDRYLGLQRGTIDGHILSLQWSSDFKLTEVAKSWLHVGLGNTSPGGLVVNNDFYKSLTPETQKIFSDTAVEAENYLYTLFERDSAKYVASAKELGVTFTTMSEPEKLKWANMMQDYPAQWAKEVEGQGQPVWLVVDTFMKLCKDEGWQWMREWGKR